LKDHVPKFLLKKKPEEAPPEEPEYGGGYGKSNGYRSEPPEEYPESIYRLADALKKAGPKRTEQNASYSKERQERNEELAKVRKYTSGVEGFHAEKATLKGELSKVDFEPLSNHLSEEDVMDLMDHVKNHPNLGYLQSITAREGLAKMLQGEVPTRNEITLLSRALPPELMKDLLKNRGWLAKSAEVAANVLNIPKTLMASYDISAPLRQGVFLIGRKEFYKALVPMVRAFASPKYERAVREAIYRDPLFPAMQDSDLAVPVYKNHNGGPALVEHEEPYMTNLAQKIPLVGIGVRASERAYNTFVYKLRADTFRAIYKAGRAADKQWTQESLKDLSRFINTFTGRGDLGKFNNAAPILNSALFSPRLLKSRIDALRPGFYAKLDPFVRKEALKSIISFAVIATTVLGLAKLSGAEVSPDIRKADGWKIKVGNTRYDILGGEQQLIRLYANIGSYVIDKGHEVATTGKIKKSYKERTARITSGSSFVTRKALTSRYSMTSLVATTPSDKTSMRLTPSCLVSPQWVSKTGMTPQTISGSRVFLSIRPSSRGLLSPLRQRLVSVSRRTRLTRRKKRRVRRKTHLISISTSALRRRAARSPVILEMRSNELRPRNESRRKDSVSGSPPLRTRKEVRRNGRQDRQAPRPSVKGGGGVLACDGALGDRDRRVLYEVLHILRR
jgi:hypothetical protein